MSVLLCAYVRSSICNLHELRSHGFKLCVCVISFGISVFDTAHGPHIVDGRSKLSAEGKVFSSGLYASHLSTGWSKK